MYKGAVITPGLRTADFKRGAGTAPPKREEAEEQEWRAVPRLSPALGAAGRVPHMSLAPLRGRKVPPCPAGSAVALSPHMSHREHAMAPPE